MKYFPHPSNHREWFRLHGSLTPDRCEDVLDRLEDMVDHEARAKDLAYALDEVRGFFPGEGCVLDDSTWTGASARELLVKLDKATKRNKTAQSVLAELKSVLEQVEGELVGNADHARAGIRKTRLEDAEE